MDIYEKMWRELVQRIINAQTWSVNKTLTYQDVLNLLASYEEHYTSEIEEHNQEIVDKIGKELITDKEV